LMTDSLGFKPFFMVFPLIDSDEKRVHRNSLLDKGFDGNF
jgi:hypothetical protein